MVNPNPPYTLLEGCSSVVNSRRAKYNLSTPLVRLANLTYPSTRGREAEGDSEWRRALGLTTIRVARIPGFQVFEQVLLGVRCNSAGLNVYECGDHGGGFFAITCSHPSGVVEVFFIPVARFNALTVI